MLKYRTISAYTVATSEKSFTDLEKNPWNVSLRTINKLQVLLANEGTLFFMFHLTCKFLYPISKTCSVFCFHVSSLNTTPQNMKLFAGMHNSIIFQIYFNAVDIW